MLLAADPHDPQKVPRAGCGAGCLALDAWRWMPGALDGALSPLLLANSEEADGARLPERTGPFAEPLIYGSVPAER